MPEANAAIDMDEIFDDTSAHNDEEISGLDFGNELAEDVDPTDAAIGHLIEVADKAEAEQEDSELETESEEAESEEELDDNDEFEYEYVVEDEDESVDEAVEAKKHMIPKRRLDDVVAKQRKAEQESAELRKELAEALAKAQAIPAIDIRALSKQRNEAVLDGDLDKAAEIDEQIHASTQQGKAESIDMEALEARVEAKMELKSTLASVFEEYPQLDTDSDSFDEDLNAEALVFQSAYLNQGYLPAEAVRRAANAAIRVVRPELLTATEAPKVAAKARTTNVKGNVDASNAQPPKMNQGESGGKTSSEMIDITKLTDEEFDALPEATRARMRGDLV
tara:strand:- start:292 stop:1299 length:1008 start_codon:yes stop_codon:yes gene_type:complete